MGNEDEMGFSMVWIWVVAGLTWVIVMMGIAQLSRFYSKFQEGRRELDANLLNMAGQFKKMQSTLTELLAEQRRITRRFDAAGLVRFLREYEDLFKNRRDPQLTKDAQTYMENIRTYRADRLRRIVNYNNESAVSRLWCDIENPVWFFITKIHRHFIWKPKVRALLEEARVKTEKEGC